MMISLLVAMDEYGTIGRGNRLPWYLSDDLQNFKRLTTGHHMIMGRKTFSSIGRALPGRVSIVLSQTLKVLPEECPPGSCYVVPTLLEALEFARRAGESEVFVIGGRQVFAEALPIAHRIYLTLVHARVQGDVHFSELRLEAWRETNRKEYAADDRNEYPFTFIILERKD